jgi:hypothetical protein
MGSISVTPASSITYYVRAEGPCGNSTDKTVTVTVRPALSVSIKTIPTNTILTCPVDNGTWIQLTATPTPGNALTTVRWHANGSGPGVDEIDWAHTRYYSGQDTATLMAAPAFTAYIWCDVTDVCGRQQTPASVMMYVPDCSTQ